MNEMIDIPQEGAGLPDQVITHPLDILTANEIIAFREIVEEAGLTFERTKYSYLLLREPHKRDVLAFRPGDPIVRQVNGILSDRHSNRTVEVLVDVTNRKVLNHRVVDTKTEGWGGHFYDNFSDRLKEILSENEEWVAALKRRGVTDTKKELMLVAPSGGTLSDIEAAAEGMVIRVNPFLRKVPDDFSLAHPIDGVIAHVDLTHMKVLRVDDVELFNVPQESGDYTDPAVTGPMRTTLKPIEIIQPEGVSFQVNGNVLSWENWSLRVGFNGREGLSLHQITYNDHGRVRPIIYRASIAEMVVAYGHPSVTHNFHTYFDAGEYHLGRWVDSLELGCDCLGVISYLPVTFADENAVPVVVKNAVCIHEEDFGILWKHNENSTGKPEVRRQRRLVVSSFTTIGNYDYGYYWYFYLDGTIEHELKATGIVYASGHNNDHDFPYATLLAPDVGGPVHQHLLCARLDMMVDGLKNSVDELQVERVPLGPENPAGNAFRRSVTRLKSERDGRREAKAEAGRVWRISSQDTQNRLGGRPSYVLYGDTSPLLLAADGSSQRERMAFSTSSLWVTQYAQDELWPAGHLVVHSRGQGGLPKYVAQDRNLDGENVVLWHTYGLTHFPRVEDWPIMPVDKAGFKLKPEGFFDRNPTLDVPPPPTGSHCQSVCHSSGSSTAGGKKEE